jgi:hypothetical protein
VGESNLEGLMKLFSFDKKKDLERYCRDLTIRSEDFFALLVACETSGEPFIHEISYRDKVPPQLIPSDAEIQALESTPAGTFLSGDAAKAVIKMSQSFVDRRYLVGHMILTRDHSKWHFFCFDQRDLETTGNHWKEGSHIHFVNWLWQGQDAKTVWSNFVTEDDRPGGAIHLRFAEQQKETGMKIKTCEFSLPAENRRSTGLHEGMFNEDVRFSFEVEIKGTNPKHIEAMLKLFEKTASNFEETWTQKLASLRQVG